MAVDWSTEEVNALLGVWGDAEVQIQLDQDPPTVPHQVVMMSKAAEHTSIAAVSIAKEQKGTIETTNCKLHNCSKCGKGYTSKVNLRRHLQLSKCKQHKLIHTWKRSNACSFCEKTFTTITNCKRHERIHTGERQYACSFCEKSFNRISTCKRHELTHNQERPYYVCSFCEKTFKHMSNWKQHERIHTGERPYDCSFCEKTFNQISNCKRHERIHTGERPYACSFCEKSFNRISTSKRHELTHNQERPYYACPFCEKTFTTISNCKQHERIHTGERPYACSFCEKTFKRMSNCKQHERIHTGERPYACPFCQKTFNQISICKQHERIHTGERPYACSFCEKTFTTFSKRKQHQFVHTGERPYACSFCEKTFTTFSKRKQHQFVHTGERPYACSFCEKTFTTIFCCKRHEHLHTDKSLYVCETCHKKFDSMSNLQRHVSTHEMKALYKCGKGLAQFETHSSLLKRQEKANQNTSPNKCSTSKAYHRKKYLLPVEANSSRVLYRKKHTSTANNVNHTALLSDCDQFDDDCLTYPDSGTFEVQDEFQGDEGITERNLEIDSKEIPEQEKVTQLKTKTARNIAILKKVDGSRENFEKVNKDNCDCLPEDVTTLGRKQRKLGTAVWESENDQNKNFDVSEKFPIETEKTNSYLAKNSKIDSLVNSFVSAAKLQGIVLHMSVTADEGIVNFVNKNQSKTDVNKGNVLSSMDIAKILRMVSEKDDFQTKKATNPIKERTHDSAVRETVNCQIEKSKYFTELLTPTDGTSSYQPQNDIRDATMNLLAKALTSAAKQQGVVLHVYCLK